MNKFKYLLSNSRKFHHLEVAKILHKNNKLTKLICGSPFLRLKENQLPKNLVDNFYIINSIRQFIPRLERFNFIHDYLNKLNVKNIDQNASKYVNSTDIFLGLSKTGLETGKLIKKKNKIYICERSSSHIIFQNEILKNEYDELGLKYNSINNWFIDRELEEYENADIILTPSKFVEETFIKHKITKAKVIHFGSYLDNFYPLQNLKKEKNEFNVLFIGQLSIRKGLHYLIEGFKKFRYVNKKLTIIGPETKDKIFFRNLLKKNNNQNIVYLGTKTHEEINKYFNKSDVFILPSLEEGLATVVLQAISSGCPVIVSENTGALEIVENNKCGFVIPIRNSNIIAEKLSELAEDEILRKKFSINAIKFSKNYTWEKYVENLDQLVENFIKKN